VELYPAIDLRDGKCVRLQQGDYSQETVYGGDPVAVAQEFEEDGAAWIHVVDLDAARTGRPENREVVAEIAAGVGIPVQSGGGIRDEFSAEALLDLGIARIVIGTAALEQPRLVRRLAGRHPGRPGRRRPARAGEAAVRGWTEGSGVTVLEAIGWFGDAGVATFIVTDIARDGMLTGPDVEGLSKVLATTTADVIASGGVGSLEDLRTLASLEVGGRRLAGAIVGKAIYEGVFSVGEAVRALGLAEA
jgi:phosphoribosylformimino-5-aminoimidazole carboxamide ribotide isomerase